MTLKTGVIAAIRFADTNKLKYNFFFSILTISFVIMFHHITRFYCVFDQINAALMSIILPTPNSCDHTEYFVANWRFKHRANLKYLKH